MIEFKCDKCATIHRLVDPPEIASLRAKLERAERALEAIKNREGDFPYARDVKQLAREALGEKSVCRNCGNTGKDIFGNDCPCSNKRPDTSVTSGVQAARLLDEGRQEGRAGGLEKAADIARYFSGLPMRNDAYRAACREIETSCLATAGRIRRGEYENPTSSVEAMAEKAIQSSD